MVNPLKKIKQIWKLIKQNSTIRSLILFVITLYRKFCGDRIIVEASHLAYITILSLVPLLTVLFSIFSVMPVLEQQKNDLKNFIFSNFVPASSDVLQSYIDEFSANASNTTVVGVIALFVVSIILINAIDQSINHIWKTKTTQRRSYVTTFAVYWMILTLGPLLFGISLSLTSYVVSLNFQGHLSFLDTMRSHILNYIPFIFSFIGLLLMYSIVPMRKVKIGYSAIAAFAAAFLFEYGKKLFSLYIVYFPTYQNIYGAAISTIPILLFWIYCSWILILLGVELHTTLQEFHDRKEINELKVEKNSKKEKEQEEEFDINDL